MTTQTTTTINSLISTIEANNSNKADRLALKAQKRREYLSRCVVLEGRIVPASPESDFIRTEGVIASGPNEGAKFQAYYLKLEKAQVILDKDPAVASAQGHWDNSALLKRVSVKVWLAYDAENGEVLRSTTRFNPEAVKAYRKVYIVGRPQLEVSYAPVGLAMRLADAQDAYRKHKAEGALDLAKQARLHADAIYQEILPRIERAYFDTPEEAGAQTPDGFVQFSERLVVKAHSLGLASSLTHKRHFEGGPEVGEPDATPEMGVVMADVYADTNPFEEVG